MFVKLKICYRANFKITLLHGCVLNFLIFNLKNRKIKKHVKFIDNLEGSRVIYDILFFSCFLKEYFSKKLKLYKGT